MESKKKKTKVKLIKTENLLVVARSGWKVGGRRMGKKEHQKVQTSIYKINKSWGYNAQHEDMS